MAVAEALVQEDSFAHENSARVVWALAWPAVALNSLQVINTLLDRGFIGHLSAGALTGHGGSSNVTFLMFSLGVALATGATAIVSRGYGAENKPEYLRGAQEALSLAVYIGVVIGLITALVARFSAQLVLPPSDKEAQDQMTRFLLAYGAGIPSFFVIQTIAGSLRAIGDTKSPMYISGIQILLHLTLNIFLIFPTRHYGALTIPGANLGLLGGGIALATSGWIAATIYVLFLPKTGLGWLVPFKLPHIDWAKRILRIAIPACVMTSLRVFSLTAFTIVLKQVSDASSAIAAMSIGFAIESVMFMPPFGLAAAAAALVGQSLGMKRPDRAERLAWTAANHGAIVTICLAGPIFLSATFIASVMTGGKAAITAESASLLRFLCCTEFLFAYAMVLIGAMQGAGDTVRPLWITVGSLWGLRVPLALAFALPAGFKLAGTTPLPLGLGMGATGAWLSMSGTQGLQGVLSIFAFKAGHWKTEKV